MVLSVNDYQLAEGGLPSKQFVKQQFLVFLLGRLQTAEACRRFHYAEFLLYKALDGICRVLRYHVLLRYYILLLVLETEIHFKAAAYEKNRQADEQKSEN
jgi:hypothetical protein